MTPRINTADWCRIGTAAKTLGVTRARVQQIVKAGDLPSIAIDGITHVRRAAVAARAAGFTPRRRGPPPGTKTRK